MPKITLPAEIDNIETATDFINGILDEADCSMKAQVQLDIALDEMMSNVARYAYTSNVGDVTVSIEILDDPRRAVLTLTDEGIPYDPLQKEDPDITLSAEERKIGGLGIYIVKKSMDDMSYAFEDGKNIVTIIKNI
ncbi:MAG: ATP-binding protein [Clostridia bacterium]|nr:ATP-binding protein [Clostridia bacterium]